MKAEELNLVLIFAFDKGKELAKAQLCIDRLREDMADEASMLRAQNIQLLNEIRKIKGDTQPMGSDRLVVPENSGIKT